MKFSVQGIALAPLPTVLFYSVAVTLLEADQRSLTGFIALLGLSIPSVYAVALFLFLPTLWFVCRKSPLTAVKTLLTGAIVSLIVAVVWEGVAYRIGEGGGTSSARSFAQYETQQGYGVEIWAPVVGGIVTAWLYWFLATNTFRQDDEPAEALLFELSHEENAAADRDN